MNIGVSSASGHLGSATVRELKARLGVKANIVGISRTLGKITALGVETRAGDFDKPDTLTEAFRGLDKLVVIPTSDMVPAARSRQAGAAIDKAVAAGVRHSTDVTPALLRFLWSSPAAIAIASLQGVLNLGNEARMNQPRHGRRQLALACNRPNALRASSSRCEN